jgi:hypothetical protein
MPEAQRPPGFRAFLAKNFTVEEYFGRLDAGEPLLLVLQSKGYIQPHIRKWLLELGLPPTTASKEEYLRQQMLILEQKRTVGENSPSGA